MNTINTLDPLIALAVFAATAAGDVLWALYIRRIDQGRALSAGFFSALIVLFGGIVIAQYVENKWYMAPAAVGAFVGTLITVRRDAVKKHPTEEQ